MTVWTLEQYYTSCKNRFQFLQLSAFICVYLPYIGGFCIKQRLMQEVYRCNRKRYEKGDRAIEIAGETGTPAKELFR